jgi:hypothetical protein
MTIGKNDCGMHTLLAVHITFFLLRVMVVVDMRFCTALSVARAAETRLTARRHGRRHIDA